MKKTYQTLLLPTEDNSLLGVHEKKGLLYAKNEGWDYIVKYDYIQPQHLYIISDDEIKEGDCIYNFIAKDVYQSAYDLEENEGVKKIIATTDTNFQVDYKESYEVQGVMMKGSHLKHLPQIPQSLVKHYVKHQPEEVELEYAQVRNSKFRLRKRGKASLNPVPLYLDKIKLQNNEVVWVEPIKGKMALVKVNGTLQAETLYTREEVERLTHIAFLAGALANAKGKDMGEYWKWSKKYL